MNGAKSKKKERQLHLKLTGTRLNRDIDTKNKNKFSFQGLQIVWDIEKQRYDIFVKEQQFKLDQQDDVTRYEKTKMTTWDATM